MLKITKFEKKILDALLTKSAKKVALDMKMKPQAVYNAYSSFKRKVQNSEEFLAVARGKYGSLLKRRLNTPKIMPEETDLDEDLLFRQHNKR